MFKDKLKGLINPEEGDKNNKKKIENLVFFVVILIVTIVIINIIWNGDKDSSNDKGIQNDTSKQLANTNTSSSEVSMNTTNELEVKLEEIRWINTQIVNGKLVVDLYGATPEGYYGDQYLVINSDGTLEVSTNVY